MWARFFITTISDNFILTLFHAACLCGELFVAHLHADEHVLVVVECFEGVAVEAAGIVVEVLVAEIVAGELAEIVVVVLVETVAVVAEIVVAQQIVVDYPAEIEADLAEIVVALVGIVQGLRLEELVADHGLSVNIEKD